MKHISLFSGIGGFDLAAQWMGWKNVAHCEWNPFGQRVLKYYWPNAISYDDITKTDFSIHRGTIDILTGGFPCQPYSVAGKRKGKEDERHLWPEMLRAIREIQPRWVVGENVRGIINWNGGLVFDEVQADLEAEGYKILPFLLPAAGVNAPHERYRTWFVACAYDKGGSSGLRQIQKENGEIPQWNNHAEPCCPSVGIVTNNDHSCKPETGNIRKRKACKQEQKRYSIRDNARPVCYQWNATNTNGIQRCEGRLHPCRFKETERHLSSCDACGFARGNWQNFPTQSPVCNGDDGLSARLDIATVLAAVGRKVNKAFKAFNWWRNESIKAGGNAIVPQEVYQIFKAIEQYEHQNPNREHQSL